MLVTCSNLNFLPNSALPTRHNRPVTRNNIRGVIYNRTNSYHGYVPEISIAWNIFVSLTSWNWLQQLGYFHLSLARATVPRHGPDSHLMLALLCCGDFCGMTFTATFIKVGQLVQKLLYTIFWSCNLLPQYNWDCITVCSLCSIK
jgi:hypothetical protein